MGRISDRRIPMIDRLRSEAVRQLGLNPGDRVIDAGCGNGGSFPFLLEQVGPTGEVVGIEISPEMTRRARNHIHENGWHNVRVIESPAQTAPLDSEFDALLLFAAHEILTSPGALDHLFGHLKAQGGVAAFGAKLTAPPLGCLANPFFRFISKMWLPLSPPIDTQPWRLLVTRLGQIRIEPRLGGVMYIVSGRKAA
jgi:demethylmenaquinone methyltransferase/2-methoxy-6-polyprenyl-1,4-benzoquinol methylase